MIVEGQDRVEIGPFSGDHKDSQLRARKVPDKIGTQTAL
jgi:hypothetical protein